MTPSLFIAHGAPLLVIENNDYTKFLNQLGQNLPRPKAIFFYPLGIQISTGKPSRSI